jgi:hypothetical protein
MESSIRMVQWVIYAMSVMVWLGAVGFAGFRIHQMRTLAAVSAEVLDAKTSSYMSKSYMRDATGFNRETRSRMYSADATVRYVYQGQEYTAEASHDVGVSSQWFQERLTRQWKPGARIIVHLDPAQPDKPLAGLGFNLNTFSPSLAMIVFGFLLLGAAYGVGRLQAVLALFEQGARGKF